MICALAVLFANAVYAETPECFDENGKPGKFYPTSRTTHSGSTTTTVTNSSVGSQWSAGASAGVQGSANYGDLKSGNIGTATVGVNASVNGNYQSSRADAQTVTTTVSPSSTTNEKCISFDKLKN